MIDDCLTSESHMSHLPLLHKDSALEVLVNEAICVQEADACRGCCAPYSLESQKRGFPPLRLFTCEKGGQTIHAAG